jgi:hypothetical protein
VLDLAAHGLQHLLIVAVVEAELLLPARGELDDDVLALVAGLAGFRNDVDVYVSQVVPRAVAALLVAAGADAGDVARHPDLLLGFELTVILRVAYLLDGNLLRGGRLLIPILVDVKLLCLLCLRRPASAAVSIRGAL